MTPPASHSSPASGPARLRAALLGIGAAALLSPGAQAATITPEQLLRAIDRARVSVDVFVPEGLSGMNIERALARAAYERGVRVRVVAPQGSRKLPSSRLNNLVLAGTNLSNVNRSTSWLYEVKLSSAAKGFVVIDNQLAYTGNVGEGFDDLTQSHAKAGSFKAWVDAVARSTQPVPRGLIHQDVVRAARGR